MPNQKKETTIEKIQSHISESQGFIFVDYRGLTNTELEALRNSVEETEGALHIFKNTLLLIAMERNGIAISEENVLTGPTAAIFANSDIAASFKVVTVFQKQHELPSIKGGFIEGEFISAEKIVKIAKLPSKEILQAQVIGQINAPISGLVFTLKGITNKLVYALEAIKAQKHNSSEGVN